MLPPYCLGYPKPFGRGDRGKGGTCNLGQSKEVRVSFSTFFSELPQNNQLTSQGDAPGLQAEEVDTGGKGTAFGI